MSLVKITNILTDLLAFTGDANIRTDNVQITLKYADERGHRDVVQWLHSINSN